MLSYEISNTSAEKVYFLYVIDHTPSQYWQKTNAISSWQTKTFEQTC